MKKYLSEFIGTFALVFFGTASIIINQEFNGVIGDLGINVVFGLVVASMIYALGDVSGTHINPVVSFIFFIASELSFKDLLLYIVSQIAGAFAASAILHTMFPNDITLGSTLPSGTAMNAFVMEVIITFILILVIFQVAKAGKEKGMFAGIAIGSFVLLAGIVAGHVSGCSMNPARSMAPAIVSGNTQHLWVYLTAPFIGAVLAFFTWKYFKSNPTSSSQ